MVLNILDKIRNENSTNKKIEILTNYKEDELLKRILYLAYSKKIKFYIKQIPEYSPSDMTVMTLSEALDELRVLYNREKTGNDAVNHLKTILISVNPDEAQLIGQIIQKDLRIGMAAKNINKAIPKLIETTPYMGAKPYSEKAIRKLISDNQPNPVYSQVKMDGRYCNAIVSFGGVELESRQGEPTILPGAKFLKELKSLNIERVFNGELTIKGKSRYESNGIITSLIDIFKKQNKRTEKQHNKKITEFENIHGSIQAILDNIVYTVWDTLTVNEFYNAKSDVPYSYRLEYLEKLIEFNQFENIKLVEYKLFYDYESVMNHFQEMLNRGEEGTVVKSFNGHWKNGKPTHQIKVKLEMTLDLRVTGFNYGTGKNKDLISSLICEDFDGVLVTQPTGISEEMMVYITEHQEELLGAIVEVKCSGISQDMRGDYSLLHPVFVSIRDDKNRPNTIDEIKEIERMVKGLK